MRSICFASANNNKYLEIQPVLSKYGIVIEFLKIELIEIQSDSIERIAIEKSKNAFTKTSKPVIVEDDGIFITELNGFPGQYASYVFKTIGNDGILKLLTNSKNRQAYFRSVVAFYDGRNSLSFIGETRGNISQRITEGGWGYDPIFIPLGTTLTYGQLELQKRKKQFSHRVKALDEFVKWYKSYSLGII
jgi:XTP/dITP diphosphohydrolase